MLSVVIPTLNEVNKIDGIIEFFNQFKDLEVIFSDGQSTDGTFEKLKKKTNIKVIKSKAGRAHQMKQVEKLQMVNIFCLLMLTAVFMKMELII